MNLDGYIRVSDVRGRSGASYISPKVQEQKIRAWAEQHGHTIDRVHTDEDRTGRNMRRPEFDVMMRRIMRRETDGVVVAKLDRFARSTAGAATAWRDIAEVGAVFVAVQENLDSTNAHNGKLIMTIFMALAEWESDRLGVSWREAREDAVGRGIHISPTPPTGYRRGEDGVLVVDEDVAPHIREAFQMRVAGATWAAIGRYLSAHGVAASKTGSTGWAVATVRKMIKNRAYLGEASSGDFLNRDAHPALVDRDVWEAAQAAAARPAPRDGNGYLLSGLIRCAGCRYGMPGATAHDVRKYRCRCQHASGRCEAVAVIGADVVEPYVVESVLSEVEGRMVATMTPESATIAELEDRVELEERRMVEWRDDVEARDILGRVAHADGLKTRLDRMNEAIDALKLARVDAPNNGGYTGGDVRAWWATASITDRRAFLGAYVDTVFVRTGRLPVADRVDILRVGEGPVDLPRRGAVRNVLTPYAWRDDVDTDAVSGVIAA